MKLRRSKNTKKNIIWGIISKLFMLAVPFLVQTVFIRRLGAEYNGLKGMFSSILQILNLTELGFGSALVFSMYKPIAEEDDETICSLLNLYRCIYKKIGTIIFTMGLAITPFLGFLINGNPPQNVNIYVVFLMYLVNTTVSYIPFAYKASLLNAYQQTNIINVISMVTTMLTSILQIITLLLFRNYYLYVLLLIFNNLFNNILTSLYVDRKYPHIKPSGNVDKNNLSAIRKKIYGLAISRICGVTRNSFDNIFLSLFLGLTITGIYNNYYYIFSNVLALLGVISSAMLAGIGNSIASEPISKNYNDFIIIDFIYMIISGWCTICMLCLYQPFMRIWVGEKLLFPDKIPLLLCTYFYVLCMGSVRTLYSDGAGLWWENRYRVILEGMANIILNYFLGKYFGVEGIIIATAISILVFGFGASAIVIFKHYFKKGLKTYFTSHLVYISATIAIAFITDYICSLVFYGLNSYLNLIGRVVVCCVIVPISYYLFYFRTQIFKVSKPWLLERIRMK